MIAITRFGACSSGFSWFKSYLSQQTGRISSLFKRVGTLFSLFKGAVESAFLPSELKSRKITWLTGSRSASIPIIDKVAEQLHEKPALIPTGQLLEHNFAPLTGEICGGSNITGINNDALSGIDPPGFEICMEYATHPDCKFNPADEIELIKDKESVWNIPRIKIAALRLLLTNKISEEQKLDLKNYISTKIIPSCTNPQTLPKEENWEAIANLLYHKVPDELAMEQPNQELKRGQVVCITRDGEKVFGIVTNKEMDEYQILYMTCEHPYGNLKEKPHHIRWLSYFRAQDISIPNKDELKALAIQKDKIEDYKIKTIQRLIKQRQESINEIVKLFENIKALSFSKNEKKLINKSFPIIWASNTIKPQEFEWGVPGEKVVYGKAELGDDIQLVFTDTWAHVRQLKKALKNRNVQVLTFDAAHYLIYKQAKR